VPQALTGLGRLWFQRTAAVARVQSIYWGTLLSGAAAPWGTVRRERLTQAQTREGQLWCVYGVSGVWIWVCLATGLILNH
jgi:hypothetical protein